MNGHWTQGGTGLTNIYPGEFDAYNAAIETYDGPGCFWIEKNPMGYSEHDIPTDYSIHCDNVKHAQEFWDHCDQVRHLIRTAP